MDQIRRHSGILERFFDAVASGEPVPNNIAYDAWCSWSDIDNEITNWTDQMARNIEELQGELSYLHFKELPARGTA